MSEWSMTGIVLYQNDTSYDEIGLCAQNMDTILDQIYNAAGRAYVIIQRE